MMVVHLRLSPFLGVFVRSSRGRLALALRRRGRRGGHTCGLRHHSIAPRAPSVAFFPNPVIAAFHGRIRAVPRARSSDIARRARMRYRVLCDHRMPSSGRCDCLLGLLTRSYPGMHHAGDPVRAHARVFRAMQSFAR